MTITSPWPPYRERVQGAWVDYNGHMNVAYYVLVFDHATDAVLDHLGGGTAYRQESNHSVFVGEMHVAYEREVVEGDALIVTSHLLAFDQRKLILLHEMRRVDQAAVVASNEVLCLHVDLAARRSAPWPAEITARFERIAAAHPTAAALPTAGRRLSLRRRC